MSQLNIGCEICLENFDTKRLVCAIPCGHIFHTDCLEQWLRLNEICPKCRLDAPQESIRRLYFNYTGFSEVGEEENDGKSDCDANSDDYAANCDEFLKKLSDQQIGIYQSESNRKNFGKRLDDLENTLKQLLTELNESVEVINKRESQLFGDTESGGK